jgi:hypothetical protein
MPLYIDDEQIEYRLCEPVASALKTIKNEMQGNSVTPSLALGLIKKHLQPLMLECDQDILGSLKKVTWEDLHWTYAEVIFRGGQPTGLLADIGVSIDLICTFTTNPPRDFPNPESVEVSSFLQVCEHLNLKIGNDIRYSNNRKFDVFNACKYCWRQPVPGRLICSSHTTGDKYSPVKLGTKEEFSVSSPFTNYKESKRQKSLFDEILKTILTKEIWEFHESGFTSPTLIPSQDIFQWMLDRRPLLAQLLNNQKLATNDDKIINNLLLLLHSPEDLTNSQNQQLYLQANNLLKTHPILIWPMLLRAESWLHARSSLRSNWGGRRVHKDSC